MLSNRDVKALWKEHFRSRSADNISNQMCRLIVDLLEARANFVSKGLRNADRLHKVLTAVGISKDEFEQVKAVKKKK